MKLYTQLLNIQHLYPNIVVALGTFDGIHYAHRKIISRAIELAGEMHGTSAVITFSNHPLQVIKPEVCPPQIISQEMKAQIIEQLGVDVLFNIPFTTEFLKWSPEYFMEILIKYLKPRCIVVGPNYSYGYKSAGNPTTLLQAGEQNGFAVEIHQPVFLEGKMVSSTTIRKLIAEGNIQEASELLERPVCYEGEVIRGEGRGHLIGYPTANMTVPSSLVLPKSGVYAVLATVSGITYKAIANVGVNPTFPQNRNKRIETFIFDFTENLYGQKILITFLKHLRDEEKFDSVDGLKKQILEDIKTAQQFYITLH